MAGTETKIALAGLLFEIGKFAQRAGAQAERPWDDAARREFGSLPTMLAAGFIDQYLPLAWKEEVRLLHTSQRRPKTIPEQALALAGYLAAGERSERDAPAAEAPVVPSRQLLSIFCALTAGEVQAPQPLYWPLAPLSLDETAIFPGAAWDEVRAGQAYAALWQEFCLEAARLGAAHANGENMAGYLEGMLLLLQRFAWCVPAAEANPQPDASLYDRSRMTAALASILCSAPADAFGKDNGGELAILVGGDLSGLQEFLYTISAQGAASALRGRSFYLQLLGEALARFVLRQLDLPITNLIYCGGGSFYLLARPGDADKLTRIQQHISRVLLHHHHGSLYLALAHTPLQRSDFLDGRISSAWENLGFSLQYAKQHRFIELGSRLATVFNPQGHGGNEEQQCQVCGAEHRHIIVDNDIIMDGRGEAAGEARVGESMVSSPAASPLRASLSSPTAIRKCPACLSYEALGEDLRRAEYLVLEQTDAPRPPALTAEMNAGGWEEALAGLGFKVALAATIEGLEIPSPGDRLVLALSDEGLPPLAQKMDAHTTVGRRMWVNVTPILSSGEHAALQEQHFPDLPHPGSIKPFDVMAAQAQGIPRLGVLRMDVDNLGTLFSRGLGKAATLSRVAGLSFAISLYFDGWVGAIAGRMNRADAQAGLGQRLYSIYSGGDDLLFVGAWDAVVELARQVRLDLTRFAAGHPGIHASAGIVLAGGKYPLAQAAQDAGRAEQQAKSLKWVAENGKPARKDAVSFLGQALPWGKFGLEADCTQPGLGSAHALMHLLVLLPSPAPLLRRLIALHEHYLQNLNARRQGGADQNRSKQDQVLWGRWMWLGYYSLQRLAEQTHNQDIAKLNEGLKQDRFRSIEWIGLAARWAELRMRNLTTKP